MRRKKINAMFLPVTAAIAGTFFGLRFIFIPGLVCLALLLILYLFLYWVSSTTYKRWKYGRWVYCFSLVTLAAFFSWNASRRAQQRQSRLPDEGYVQMVLQVASQSDSITTLSGRQYLRMDCRLLGFADHQEMVQGRERVQVYVSDALKDTLLPGAVFSTRSKVFPFESPNTPTDFDYAAYMAGKNCYRRTYVYKYSILGELPRWTDHLERLRMRVAGRFSGPEGALVAGVCLGDKGDMARSLKESYADAGASHILAVSGLHVGALYGTLSFLIGALPAIVILWIYAAWVGFPSSVLRAVIMLSLFVIGKRLNRRAVGINSLCVAALVLVLVNPYYLTDVGFQLSFCAVASLFVFFPYFRNLLSVRKRVWRYLWEMCCCSFSVQLGTAWLCSAAFGKLPLYGILSSMIVIPLCTLMLYVFLVYLLFFCVYDCFSLFEKALHVLETVLEGLANVMNTMVEWIASWPCATLSYQPDFWIQVLMLWLLFYFWLVISGEKKNLAVKKNGGFFETHN